MFELYIILVLALITKKITPKVKYYYELKKKHREIMKLYVDDTPSKKVIKGLRKSIKKSGIKPNNWCKKQLGLDRSKDIHKANRLIQVTGIFLPFCFMNDLGVFLIPFIIGAVLIRDAGADLKVHPGGYRLLTRSPTGVYIALVISDATDLAYLTKSVDGGADWGTNHPTYDNNQYWNKQGFGGAVLHRGTICICDDDSLQLIIIEKNLDNCDFWWHENISTTDLTAGWTADARILEWYIDLTAATFNNKVYMIFSHQCNGFKIIIKPSLAIFGASNVIFAAGATCCEFPAVAFDTNGQIHCVFEYQEADSSIRYFHRHDPDVGNWFQSDDVTQAISGATSEEIMTLAGKDFINPSISCNPFATKINDIWVTCNNDTDEEVYAIQYDKSGAAWQAQAKISNTDNAEYPQVGIGNDGIVRVFWNIRVSGNIRYAEYDTSWSSPVTKQS